MSATQKTVIHIWSQNCALAGKVAHGVEDENDSPDYWRFEGTTSELEDQAKDLIAQGGKQLNSNGAYLSRCGRSILSQIQ